MIGWRRFLLHLSPNPDLFDLLECNSMPGEAILLLSGGMDSATCLWWMAAERQLPVCTVSIDYGQRHAVELEYAERLSRRAGVRHHQVLPMDLRPIGGSPLVDRKLETPAARDKLQAKTVVPLRNMLMVTLAAAYAETRSLDELYLAPVRDDHESYRDCRREFYDSLESSLSLASTQERSITIHTPFVDKWKTEVVEIGLRLQVPYALTHTCYAGRRPACGICDACVERIAAFESNASADPLEYEIDVT
jgi:7-cyano-7-deazaguanine synthase